MKKLTTSLTAEYIKKRVARRFGIIGKEFSFSVFVNGEEVSISDRDYFHKLSYIWYFGNESKNMLIIVRTHHIKKSAIMRFYIMELNIK